MLVHLDLSTRRLRGVRHDLFGATMVAADKADFFVGYLGGVRTPEQQAQLVAQGRSWTLNSKHLTGSAVDLVAYDVERREPVWSPVAYERIRDAMFAGAAMYGIKLSWGGDWRQRDLGHFELSWSPMFGTVPVPRPKKVEIL